MIRLLITLLFIFPNLAHASSKKPDHYLSVCAVFQDEARFLKEWIEFHRLVGVEHFYLFNNCSHDHFYRVLHPYIEKGIVDLYDWSYDCSSVEQWSPVQCRAYQKIIKEKKKETEWLAILDIDEFLFPVKEESLVDVLQEFEPFGGVCVNWQMFGTSHLPQVPSSMLMIECLLMKAEKEFPWNIHVKSIVRPKYVEECYSPHCCSFQPGFYQMTENMVPFEGAFSPTMSIDRLCINHYWTRDEEFFYGVKIPRRERWGQGVESCIEEAEKMNCVTDRTILKYVHRLREKVL